MDYLGLWHLHILRIVYQFIQRPKKFVFVEFSGGQLDCVTSFHSPFDVGVLISEKRQTQYRNAVVYSFYGTHHTTMRNKRSQVRMCWKQSEKKYKAKLSRKYLPKISFWGNQLPVSKFLGLFTML